MVSLRYTALLCSLISVGSPFLQAQDLAGERIEILPRSPGSIAEFNHVNRLARYLDGVTVKYTAADGGTVTLTAEEVELDEKDQVANARGDVTVEAHGLRDGVPSSDVWRGESAIVRFRTSEVEARHFRAGQAPFFIRGESFRGQGGTSSSGKASNVVLTTDDLAHPGYRIEAQEMSVEGRLLKIRKPRLYVGDVPILALPGYTKSLDPHRRYWELMPGFRSLFGPFLLTSYNWKLGTNAVAGIDLDWRQRRGIGAGPKLEYDLGSWGRGGGSVYGSHDDLPPAIAPGVLADSWRNRARWTHQVEGPAGFSATGVLRWQTDRFIVRDFFENEFRSELVAPTFLEARKDLENWSLNVLARPQVNDFFTTVERLPEIRLSGWRQQLGTLPIFYESESSLAYLRHRSAFDPMAHYAALRADTGHQVVAPHTFFGWLNVTPVAGVRFTHYGEGEGAAERDSANRGIFHTGGMVSWKASRTWAGATNRWLDLSGLRHISEPSVQYAYVPRPSSRVRDLPQFDPEFPSLRPLPLTLPDYEAVDSIDSQSVIRFGWRNRLMTRRGGAGEDLLNWRLLADWRLRPQPGQTTIPELYSELDFSPRTWATLSSDLRFDVYGGTWRESSHRITLRPNDVWQWTLGHRYLASGWLPGDLGNNLAYSSALLRVNENYAIRFTHQFEGRDGVLEEQQYTLYRDFRSWTGALSFRLRDNRRGPDDWAVVLTFSLKAFPRFDLGRDRDRVGQLFDR